MAIHPLQIFSILIVLISTVSVPLYRSRLGLNMHLPKFLVILAFMAFLTAGGDVVASPAEPKTITARWVAHPITVDGQLDEFDWALAEPVSDFVQSDPEEGASPSERTEVRVLFDDNNLYFGIYCYDSQPDQVITNELKRDFNSYDSDALGVVIDAFHNHRDSVAFFTNPGGAKRDAEAQIDGRYTNVHWDGIWHTAAHIQEDGWTSEIVIPFKTLRFTPSSDQIMGVNFKRRIRRRNEAMYWSPVPRRYNTNRVSLAGDLLFLKEIETGRNLTVKPYLTSTFQRTETGSDRDNDLTGDVGGDLKYSLTQGVTLDLTYNTDFSQVEVDAEQINLTRFSVFFPEKRDFFLEHADLFQFGDIPQERGPSRGEETQLFYSRQIGLSPQGRPLPLLGGVRLSGRMGGFGVGFLTIHQEESEGLASNLFTVARVRRDVFSNSEVGAIFVNREGGEQGDYNRAYGIDANFQFVQNLTLNGYLAGTQSPGRSGENLQTKISSKWDDGFWGGQLLFADIGENFNPEVGFVPRTGVRNYQVNFGFKPRPGGQAFIREFNPHLNLKYYTDRDNLTLTKDSHYALTISFRNGGSIEVSHNPLFERLTEDFTIRQGITIPVGDYFTNEFRIRASSDRSQLLSGSVDFSEGGFFDGDRTSIVFSGSVLLKPRLSATLSYNYNRIDLEGGKFPADLYSLQTDYSFSPSMFLGAFIQYNTHSDRILTNIRFNWIHRPLSDITVVFTEDRDTGASTNYIRSLTFKYTHLLQF